MRRVSGPYADERGATAVIVAVAMTVLLGMAALVVDAGALYNERRVLQNGADAAALAVARNCAGGACGATDTLADRYADANAGDGASAVEGVSVDGQARTVTVDTRTETASGGEGVRMHFARIFGIEDPTVRASATATWGPPARMTARPLVMSFCEFDRATVDGTRFAEPPFTSPPVVVRFHEDSNGTNGSSIDTSCHVHPGHDVDGDDRLSGGFGWADSDADCKVTILAGSIASAEPGNSAGAECDPDDFKNQTILMPVFDDLWRTGNTGRYHVAGFAALVVTGFRFPGTGWSWNAPCNAPITCIGGHFVRYVTEAGEFGGETLGVQAVRLTK